MIDFILPLLDVFLSSGLWSYFFLPFIALCFLASVPCVIRYIIGLRGR